MSDGEARDRQRLWDLTRRLEAAEVENRRLRNLLKITHGVEPPPEQPAIALADPGLVTDASPAEAKLALYGRRFAARRDVYAAFWQNEQNGTKGWAPQTRYHDKRPISERGPFPLTNEVLTRHLSRNNDLFIGLYPLLPDATCWWLAADFDGSQAILDAHAYVRAAASLGVPCALEISQSGRGAHVWTFFDAPVRAADARAMGTACVHRAMALRGSMTLASYDRLFPNQDTVPNPGSGVGNLIAAPLEGRRRYNRGTTVFVDLITWEPFADQWEYLSGVPEMSPHQVAAVARQDKIVVGAELTRLERAATAVRQQPREQVRAILDARLTIQDDDLTPELAAALRHAATMHNPDFYERQRARRSTFGVARFLQGFDVTVGGDLVLPRGLREQAASLVAQAGSSLLFEDARNQGTELDVSFSGRLDTRQVAAVDAILACEDGILHAPTGSGKTVMACAIIAERAVSTLVLINRAAIAAQWREHLQTLLGVKAGQLGGGRRKLTGQVDVMFLQTLSHRSPEEIRDLTSGYGQVIVDECHHIGAPSYQNTIAQIGAAWWLGLSATPDRKDGLHPQTCWQLGPVRYVMRDVLPRESDLVTPYTGPQRVLRLHETDFRVAVDFDPSAPGAMAWLGGSLAADEQRNQQIVRDIQAALRQGRKCLVLSRRRDHLTLLAGMLPEAQAMIMRGGTSKQELAVIRERLASAGPKDPLLVMTTVPFGGEGFDAPVIDTEFLVGPISFVGLLQQAVGRALRPHVGKTDVVVHDYVDAQVPVLKAQYDRRRVGYRQMGFECE